VAVAGYAEHRETWAGATVVTFGELVNIEKLAREGSEPDFDDFGEIQSGTPWGVTPEWYT